MYAISKLLNMILYKYTYHCLEQSLGISFTYFIMDLLSMIFMPTIYLYQSRQGNDIYRYYQLYKYYVKWHNIYIQVGTSQVRVNTCFVYIFLNVLFTLLNLSINIWV